MIIEAELGIYSASMRLISIIIILYGWKSPHAGRRDIGSGIESQSGLLSKQSKPILTFRLAVVTSPGLR